TDDFRITRADGTSFTVSLSALPPVVTVQDLLNRINGADGNTNPATRVVPTLNALGNGITLTDPTSGPPPSGSLTVTALNSSSAAHQLGIDNASTAGVIAGS